MTLKEKLMKAVGPDCTEADEMVIDRIVKFDKIFREASEDVNNEGYRRPTADLPLGVRPERNARYHVNLAFTAMMDSAKQLRADFEILGLSKKGKKIEITSKIDTGLSLLEQMNNLPDE